MTNQITLTDAAQVKVAELLAEEKNPAMKLRVFVQGGGCAGFSYGFAFDDTVNEDDFTIGSETAPILIDAMTMQYMHGAVIDYKEDLMGAAFSIENPNAQSTCGCGSSFSVSDDYEFNYE